MSALARLALVAALVLVTGCGTAPTKEPAPPSAEPRTPPPSVPSAPAPKPGYYKDDGPGATPPANLDAVPDATPRVETLHRFANRPYTVFGREYVPATTLRPYRERGVASWYGRKFHGEKTSTGDTYDMYAMTAAHPTLPLPSYARVTSLATGKSVIVRVNDRGPFLHDRLIDLSYAAAHRIGIAQKGSGEVEVEAILPGPGPAIAAAPLPPVAAPAAPVQVPPPVTTLPAAGASGGYAVQMGAFANYANAQNFLEHVQNQLAAAQVEAKIRQVNGLFRVYVGPYSDRDEAQRVAQRLAGAFGLATTVAPH
jgi:rare lipoprotein A